MLSAPWTQGGGAGGENPPVLRLSNLLDADTGTHAERTDVLVELWNVLRWARSQDAAPAEGRPALAAWASGNTGVDVAAARTFLGAVDRRAGEKENTSEGCEPSAEAGETGLRCRGLGLRVVL